MVKIAQKISDFSEIEEGEYYTITEIVETSQKNEDNETFDGLTISFRPLKETEQTKKVEYRITAWYGNKGFIGSKSKLGAFKSAFVEFFEKDKEVAEALSFAEDTDNWINHIVKVLEWRNKNREIKVTK